ncbi:MAG: thioredoxin reductase [Acidobacteria bacterium OLB17]|nr:MAG: thioredoxin reductase [Acidobacteria bacterium OLB17]MCZ2389891.1 NAD(P)/FAD-dependent oxidoreductase [Acidobacteriota bacterium]
MDIGTTQKNVIIIGGGPAGLAASIWCSDLGISHLLLEQELRTGGQLHKIFQPIPNYPGILTIDGASFAETLAEQAKSLGGTLRTHAPAATIDGTAMEVRLATGEKYAPKAIILATGVRRRRLGLPGEADLSGVLESGSKQAAETKGARVAIVGGGDAAFENALILAKYASEVTLIHHSSRFRSRAEFTEPVSRDPKIRMLKDSVVKEIVSENGQVRGLLLERNGAAERIDVDFLLVRIGVVPNSELVKDLAELDAKNYVVIDAHCETTLRNVFAIGDVATPISPTISTAVGQAATAVKVIKERFSRS